MGRGTAAPAMAPAIDRAAPEGPTDHALVAATRRGDDRAFELLYGRYHRRIAAYVYGMVNDYARAEDVTQDVFISALRRMRETERPIAFKPWIYEIAKNACIDQFRRSRRAEEVSYDAEEGLGAADYGRLVTTGPSLDAAVDTKQQLSHLCGAFGGLSETHHQILVLRELEGLSYREIGERMGLSRPSVESTLFRARRRLTEEYDELVSGQRCVRIQGIIESAQEGLLGARDTRRLARHVAHCQPCRRQAIASGVDTGTITRVPLREKAAARVAALLPFPFLLRRRGAAPDSVSGMSHAPAISAVAEPMIVGWSKAVAAATLLMAGVGGGAAVVHSSSQAVAPLAHFSTSRPSALASIPVEDSLPVVHHPRPRAVTGHAPVARTNAPVAHRPVSTGAGGVTKTTKPIKPAGDGGLPVPRDVVPCGETCDNPPVPPPTPPPVHPLEPTRDTSGVVQSKVTEVNPQAGHTMGEVRQRVGG